MTTNTELSKNLTRLLADTYTLYMRTQNYHWNVTGRSFYALHLLFEQHYTELATAIDTIAERIRALGVRAPGSYEEFAKLTTLAPEKNPSAEAEMIKALIEGHEKVKASAKAVDEASTKTGDSATQGIAVNRLEVHEKALWMLKSLQA